MALLKLAFRNLRRNRKRTIITLVALVLGVMVMVGLRGFINGMQHMLLENIVQGQLGALQVHHVGYVENVLSSPLTLDMADTPELRARVAAVPGVVAVAPRIQFGAMISTPDKKPAPEDGSELADADKGKTTFFMATAIDPAAEAKVTPRRSSLVGPGAMFAGPDATEVVLNADFAVGLEATIHPPGTPMPPVEQQTALLAADRDSALNGQNVVLGGTLPSFAPGDKRLGLVPLGTAQKLLRMEGRVTEYAVALQKFETADATAAALRTALGPDYEVHTWDQLFPFVKQLLGQQDFIYGIITSIFLVVVLLGIVNAMLMSVLERVREIGTMLAVGMKRRQVVSLFLLEGLVLGGVGASVGAALGLVVVWVMASKGIALPAPGATVPSFVHPFVTWPFVLRTLLQASVGSVLAALWPAMRASALRPVEALNSP